MADEFIKGLGIFTGAGLGWLVLAGWYRTPGFESTRQLVSPVSPDPASADMFNLLAIGLMDTLLWFAILGPLAFWVILPAVRQARKAMNERQA
ncbi:hypothetical protein DU500_09435 [Haloplanus rubicundus]|jgi:hypothetical protein|uniref:DUF7314 domain-containing protein n=1 Tax=Haloplanus rubicundus TaxID=1547898 RepID=A0A345ECT7_9EURY|nr:hypothetical protein [Haloplanus rubicundus]AXG06634.1 hypothetical protein DU500_09435 [Haloplanus rubicundus]AXG10009.1 hypothetical protein DU484_09185 [Haloplanus rubicundus]